MKCPNCKTELVLSYPQEETKPSENKKITILGIDCYGPMSPESNVLVVGTMMLGGEKAFEEFYTNDFGAATWNNLLRDLLPWAHRIGLKIEELKSC